MSYSSNRKKWSRPQAVIWSNNFSGIINGIPQITGVEGVDFILLSDHNRSEIDIKQNRLENKKRMVNGHMRSYHIADKIEVNFSYDNLPSRAFSKDPMFVDGKPTAESTEESPLIQYTVDGGAGGADLLSWYEENPGSFYMLMSYDKNSSLKKNPYEDISGYTDVAEVYFTNFDHSVIKRGGSSHDLWNISISLEEV